MTRLGSYLRIVAVLLALGCAAPLGCNRPPIPADSITEAPPAAAPLTIDSFAEVAAWSPAPADGVAMSLGPDAGAVGPALRLDFRFTGGGWAIARREFSPPLALPANYEFRFRLRGEAPVNTLEFKLLDATGQNVWWSVRRDLTWPREWETVRIKKRHVSFAWGPAGGGELPEVGAIEFAVTAGTGGGAGTIWIDELELVPLPAAGGPVPAPVARASSEAPGSGAALALDGDPRTAWAGQPADPEPRLELDLGLAREFSGLTLDWAPGRHASDYVVEATDGADPEGDAWRELARIAGGNGGRDHLFLPESEARRLRVRSPGPAAGGAAAPALAEIAVQPLDWAATREDFFARLAAEAPRGHYPRAFGGEQAYWTVVGVDADLREALLSEDGALEAGPGRFSVEPFLWAGGRLLTWADVEIAHTLDDAHLPIPGATWRAGDLELQVTAFGDGPPGASAAITRYALRNHGDAPVPLTLYLALRPFQVNPPSQWLNRRGGTAPVRSLSFDGSAVLVDGEPAVRCLDAPAAWGAASFAAGEIVSEHLAAGRLPAAPRAEDPFAAASGALAWPLKVAPGEEHVISIAVPLHAGYRPGDAPVEARLAAARTAWHDRLGDVEITVPPPAQPLLDAMWAQVGWILVNRAGPALQPGTRSYARSWIRDGALTGSALLRLGLHDVVAEFLEWYAPHQFPDGKVPCVVDARGADPVPEHDSSGELIFLAAEHLRTTGDRDLARRLWPHARHAAAYLDSLRHLRLTPEYERPELAEFRGLLPPSISHEGYSAAPMHSYWDDLFALRGFRDAAWLAGELGEAGDAARFAAIADEFARDLRASVEATMRRHGIDYVPGCADLGDFDATSTTIALQPIGLADALPPDALRRTFTKYLEFFRARREGTGGEAGWTTYTPYEIRNVGALVALGLRDEAHEAVDYFMADRRPPGWQQWPEVIRRDPREPGFLGDLPHGWVGSDYVRSFLDMLAYADLGREQLVLMAGVPWEWFADRTSRLAVRGLRTPWGVLTYSVVRDEAGVLVDIEAGLRLPPGGIVLHAPLPEPVTAATIDGAPATAGATGALAVPGVPARIIIR